MKKRIIALLAAAMLVMALLPATALAHGNHGGSGLRSTAYTPCAVEGCTKTTTHKHDGVACFSHTGGDGHGTHRSGHGGSGRHR